MNAIVVGCTPYGNQIDLFHAEDWCTELRASIPGHVESGKVIPMTNVIYDEIMTYDFEIDAIRQASYKYDEFIFVPMSTTFNTDFFYELLGECFTVHAGVSVSLSNTPSRYGMYLGKYRSERLRRGAFPEVKNKLDAVVQETVWTAQYCQGEYVEDLVDMPETDVFIDKFDRINMVTKSKYLTRYKSCWDGPSLVKMHERIEELRHVV